ncbi:MAG: transporter [Syntrophaceae bacterium]|nr:transporter [Syntrophaceae bacterium]
MRKGYAKELIFAMALFIAFPSWAAHPLITDDAGTQGKGNFQVELTGQYDRDKESMGKHSVKTKVFETAATLSYGIVDNIDLVLSLPYVWEREKEDGAVVYKENGIGDTSFEAKIKLFEKDGFSLALKPGISFPTGDEDKGLGTGKLGGHIFSIGSKELGSWVFHANLGYIRNENGADERENIWHASLAATWEVVKNLNLVANVGGERNPDGETNEDPAFLVGGIIYSVNENFDIDFGVKYGLTDPKTDVSTLVGLTFRF